MTPYLCATCCAEFPPATTPPAACPICLDERQYVPATGQAWITGDEVARHHHTEWRQLEPGLLGIGVEPAIGIGQRALLVEHPDGGVLWDGVPLLDARALTEINRRGGVRAIAMSHPHLYGAMVTNAQNLGNVPIFLPEADRQWAMRPSDLITYWSGNHYDLGDELMVHRTGGHFQGSSFLHWPAGADGQGVLLTGDTIIVVADNNWVGFMYTYPNHIPLGPAAIQRIVAKTEPLAFDRLYSGWWDAVIDKAAKTKIAASEQRILTQLNKP